MISVVIPTFNAEARLASTLTALVPGAVAGLIREVIVVDGGSDDATKVIADAAGCTLVQADKGRGVQLKIGADAARANWMMFLHADTVLEPGWEHEAAQFIERIDSGALTLRAAVFRFKLDDLGAMPRLVESGVAARCAMLGLPYGDQGLLIRRDLYLQIGGYRPLALMEDVDMVRRLGRRRLTMLRTAALTSAARYKREGYVRRIARNLSCLVLYGVGVPVRHVERIYR